MPLWELLIDVKSTFTCLGLCLCHFRSSRFHRQNSYYYSTEIIHLIQKLWVLFRYNRRRSPLTNLVWGLPFHFLTHFDNPLLVPQTHHFSMALPSFLISKMPILCPQTLAQTLDQSKQMKPTDNKIPNGLSFSCMLEYLCFLKEGY